MNLIIIYLSKIRFLKDKKAFTLLEVTLAITILSLILTLSFSFFKFFTTFFKNEESKLFSKLDEKIVFVHFNREFISAKDIQIKDDNEISFISYYINKESQINYSLYYSDSIKALGKKVVSNRQAVINNISDIKFEEKEDLIYINFVLVDADNNKRKITKIFKPRIRSE
ncbi:MAG: prepilin-type N-terminal cleavage/methylation domain-containing protein [Bacillota bacterium]